MQTSARPAQKRPVGSKLEHRDGDERCGDQAERGRKRLEHVARVLDHNRGEKAADRLNEDDEPRVEMIAVEEAALPDGVAVKLEDRERLQRQR